MGSIDLPPDHWHFSYWDSEPPTKIEKFDVECPTLEVLNRENFLVGRSTKKLEATLGVLVEVS